MPFKSQKMSFNSRMELHSKNQFFKFWFGVLLSGPHYNFYIKNKFHDFTVKRVRRKLNYSERYHFFLNNPRKGTSF